jgi:chitin disaccharide deacetylase
MSHLRLLTRADDAGLNHTTNRAIRASVKQGIVRNISLLATAPAINEAAEVLGDLAEIVDFGLHVCLTSEWRHPRYRPVSEKAAALTRPDGTFPATVAELRDLGPVPETVEEEVESQLRKLLELGIEIRYLDEHMLVGDIDAISPVLDSIAKKHGLLRDRTLRESKRLVRLPEWSAPGPHPGTELADHLSGLASGTYLIVGHPGFKADEMQQLVGVANPNEDALQARNRERRMFTDIEIVDYCGNAGIELLRYRDLA